ncbi:MAG: hypothetical protein M9962_08445 [Oligoflexia bacterium]|nr:hypothetical protein [Oligoflexia bacterium]
MLGIMKFYVLLVVFSLYISSCSHQSTTDEGERSPDSSASVIPIPTDLEKASEQFLNFIKSDDFNAKNCPAILNNIYQRMYKIDAQYFDKKKSIKNADKIIKNLWQSKLELRKRLKEFYGNKNLSRECSDASRNIFRAGRYIEDYIGYLKVNPAPFDEKKTLEAYAGGFPYLLTNEKKLQFKSGDILMSRGTAFTSAAIARVGDIDAQFSHLAILYIDKASGKKYTVEAHIEIGTKTFTFEEYLKDGKGRAVLFRYADSEMAHLAAKRMFEEANRASNAGENIPYDFGMVTDEPSELFCSEIVQYGFDMASKQLKRKFHVPLFPTKITVRNRDFFDALGIKVKDTFAPADMEVDPRVELIAEWRDYSRVRMLHHHDAVLVKIYDWMERYDYTIHGDILTFFKKNLAWSLRRWPIFSSLLKDKFPKNMSKDTLGTVFKLNSIAENMFEALAKADEKQKLKTGLPMTPKNMDQFLEAFRKADLKAYREQKNCVPERGSNNCNLKTSKIHWDFRPRNEP